MKRLLSILLIKTILAAIGDDCSSDPTICDFDGLECALWDDIYYGYQETCEDCTEGDSYLPNTYGDMVLYNCPREPSTEEPKEEEETGGVLRVIGITTGVAGIGGVALAAGAAVGAASLLLVGGGGYLAYTQLTQ